MINEIPRLGITSLHNKHYRLGVLLYLWYLTMLIVFLLCDCTVCEHMI